MTEEDVQLRKQRIDILTKAKESKPNSGIVIEQVPYY